MSIVKSVLGATVGLQSVALLGRGMSMVPKDFSNPKYDGSGRGIRANKGRGGCSKTKPLGQGKKMIGGFTDIMVGTALIGPTSSMVNTLS